MLWLYLWIAVVVVLFVIRMVMHWRLGRDEPSIGKYIALAVTGMCLVVGVAVIASILLALA